jgi:hypothetical protein
VKLASTIESVTVSSLRSHPENSLIFGDPEESFGFDDLKASLRAVGQQEAIIAKRDGVVLSGHRRLAALIDLKVKFADVRWADCDSYRDELECVVRSNTDRRQLAPREIAYAFKRLKETPREGGGAKVGQGKRTDLTCGPGSTSSKSRDDAAAMLGVGPQEARSLETVFTTPGVPEDLKAAVNAGKVKPTPAAKAVRAEVKRQGGEVSDPGVLSALAVPKARPRAEPEEETHEERVERQADDFRRDMKALFELYVAVDKLLTKRPLKSVTGPTEHHEWTGLIRDVGVRAWREIESVIGATETGRQLALVKGGLK